MLAKLDALIQTVLTTALVVAVFVTSSICSCFSFPVLVVVLVQLLICYGAIVPAALPAERSAAQTRFKRSSKSGDALPFAVLPSSPGEDGEQDGDHVDDFSPEIEMENFGNGAGASGAKIPPQPTTYGWMGFFACFPLWMLDDSPGLRSTSKIVRPIVRVVWFILAVAMVFLLYKAAGGAFPRVEGSFAFDGLKAPITITRSREGVPHIECGPLDDCLFGLGVVHAQDRFFQMESHRLIASGRLSTMVGEAGLGVDKFVRTLGMPSSARDTLELLDEDTYAFIQSYTDGINAWYKSPDFRWPLEMYIFSHTPEPFEIIDTLYWVNAMQLDLDGNVRDELVRYVLKYEKEITEDRINTLMPNYPEWGPTIITDPYDPPAEANAHPQPQEEEEAIRQPRHQAQTRHSTKTRDFAAPKTQDNGDVDEVPTAGVFESLARSYTPSSGSSWSYTLWYYTMRPLLGLQNARPDSPANNWLLPWEDIPAHEFQNIIGTRSIWGQATQASNNWVIGGQHTQSGKPILANDPHLGLAVPSIWYLVSMRSSEEPNFDVIGAAFPGIPGVMIGRNQAIAWGITNVGGDVQDTFIVTPDGPDAYMLDGVSTKYEIEASDIPLKDGTTVPFNIRHTVFGPVITEVMGGLREASQVGDKEVALSWMSMMTHARHPASGPDTTVLALKRVNAAQNYDEWRSALADWVSPPSNLIFGCVDGTIAYQTTGVFPIRPATANGGDFPQDGSTIASQWTGRHEYDWNPRMHNPQEGFIVSANNKVNQHETTHDGHLMANDGDYAPPFRSGRIREMIEDHASIGTKITVDTVMAMQHDQTSRLWTQILGPLLSTFSFDPENVDGDDKAAYWQTRLLAWDGNMAADSQEATVAIGWFGNLRRIGAVGMNYGDSWPNVNYIMNILSENSTEADQACKDSQYDSCRDQARDLFRDGVATAMMARPGQGLVIPPHELESVAGKPESVPKWGDIHGFLMKHAILDPTPLGCMFRRVVPEGGDNYCVNVSPPSFSPTGPPHATHGPSYRHVVDLGNLERSMMIMPLGQHENPISPHFDNWQHDWGQGARYLPQNRAFLETDQGVKVMSVLPASGTPQPSETRSNPM